MMCNYKTVLAGLLGLLFSVSAFAGSETVLKDFSGQPASIEAQAGKGRWLVVVIWASDCHVCDMEMPEYAAYHARNQKGDGPRVLGISLDGEEGKAEAQAFIARHKLPFDNLIAEPQELMLYYMMITGASFVGTPTILVYAPDGQLSAAQAGAVPVSVIEDFIAGQTAAKP